MESHTKWLQLYTNDLLIKAGTVGEVGCMEGNDGEEG